MVDAVALRQSDRSQASAAISQSAPSAFSATVHASAASFVAACAPLDLHAPPQSPLWVSCWLESVKPDAILVTVEMEGKTVLGIGLQSLLKSSFKIARVLGLTHANANFFPLSSALSPQDDRACIEAAITAVKEARPDIHALVFERLSAELDGRRNPFLSLPSQPSPNIALSADISGGFETLLEQKSGARKKKRQRYHRRKLEALGPVQHLRPRSDTEVDAVLDAFFSMKADRLREMGIADVFGPESVRDFFRRLFRSSAESAKPDFVLDALVVDGKIRAVTGSSIQGERLFCDFSGFVNDDSASASPGDYLLYENIKAAADDGFTIYDLGVGDEPYKRSWCDIETQHSDVFVALTPVGSLLVAAQRAKTRLIAAIKSNRHAWSAAKAVRGILTNRRG